MTSWRTIRIRARTAPAAISASPATTMRSASATFRSSGFDGLALADNSTVTLNRSVGGRFRAGATGLRGGELNQHVGRSDESAADEQVRSQFLVRIRDGCPRGKPCGHKQREQTRENGFETINQSSLGRGDVPLPTVHQHVAAESTEQNQDA